MSDLLERLRIIASGVIHDGNDWEVVRKAAEEIARLQAVLGAAREAIEEWAEFRDHEAEMCVLAEKIRAYEGEKWNAADWLDKAHEFGRSVPWDGEVEP